MKLSDFKDEEALDLLADIIEPATEIIADKDVAKTLKGGGKPVTAVKFAIKNHKKAVIEILAALDGVPVEEFTCDVLTLPKKLLEILNEPMIQELFTSAGQTADAKSSTSPTENTEENEQ